MELHYVIDGVWRTDAVDTRRMVVQIVGNCEMRVMLSLDGRGWSQRAAKSVIGSHVQLLDLPEGGKAYIEVRGKEQPIVSIL